MSKVLAQSGQVQALQKTIRLGVKDTDFLLKLILRSTFEGSELQIASTVMDKLANIHREYLGETDE
tara:strand:+ start:252 stop:449 length:198 start_codon:yes stop_codon:yes gene_type:complete